LWHAHLGLICGVLGRVIPHIGGLHRLLGHLRFFSLGCGVINLDQVVGGIWLEQLVAVSESWSEVDGLILTQRGIGWDVRPSFHVSDFHS